MKYMLLMNGTRENPKFFGSLPPEDIQAHVRFMIAARISAAPGRGGVPLNFPVELRPVGVAPEA